jgi:hypothetical protein
MDKIILVYSTESGRTQYESETIYNCFKKLGIEI